jgi:spore germination protein KB
MSLANIDIQNIFPILETGFKKITESTIENMAFPFAETVLFLPLACFLKKNDNPYKIYISGLLIGGLILLVIIIRNLTVLGVPMLINVYYPSFLAVRVIELGNFLTNFEGIVTLNFLFAGITKITICLMAASLGISKMFAVKDYKNLLTPMALIILSISLILYNNIIEMDNFSHIYWLVSLPFQVIIPLIVWITAEIKRPKKEHLT